MAERWHCIFSFFGMQGSSDNMFGTKQAVTVIELKRLLVELREYRPDIHIRYRLLGEMWSVNFMLPIMVMENGLLLKDEYSQRLLSISDLSMIMQFELDDRFRDYQPLFHYDVVPFETF